MAQHSNKLAKIQAVTANRLLDGHVVYFTAAGEWSDWVDDVVLADGKEEADALLAKAQPSVETRHIVDPYLFEIDQEDGKMVPKSVREKIRMAGPTIRLDLGKQAVARS